MRIKIYICLFLSLLLISSRICAQPSTFKADPAVAKQFYNNNNFLAAIKVYLLLLNKEPENVEYNHQIAKCYIQTNALKAKAIPHLEFLSKQEKVADDVWLDLGKSYHFANRFNDAIKSYKKYLELIQKNKSEAEKTKRFIEESENGKVLVQHPLNVSFENLGKNVNSEFPDFYPMVTADESYLYFTSRRKSATSSKQEFDGLYPSDIYFCVRKDGKWSKATSVGTGINTPLDEQIVDLNQDGTVMLFYIDHIDVFGDIWICRKLNSKSPWLKPERLPDVLNSGMETSASFYKDLSTDGEIMLIASSQAGTADNPNYGQTDIYMSRKLPTGEWGKPKNLGTDINTPYKEDFPQLSEDGKTLYFASQGHSSMGGYDIFKSVWDEVDKKWSAPKNVGYPINTAGNDLNIRYTYNPRIAYTSSVREGGFGDLDLYRVIFNDLQPKEVIYKGYVSTIDTSNKIRTLKIEVVDKKSDELYGTYLPNPVNCYYIMALPPGKWTMRVDADGFETYSEDLLVQDESVKFNPEITKNIQIKKK